jgi:acyl-CoA thioester hydrolase
MGSAEDGPGDEPAASAFPVHRRFTTRWADNDVYGHLNNVVYYEFFDSAVNGWLIDAAGVDIRELPAIGVVAETSCRYLRQISFPGDVSVGLALARVGTSSVVYQLGVFGYERGDLDPRPRAVGRFVHVYVDAQTRRPVPVPGPVRSALAALEQGRQ